MWRNGAHAIHMTTGGKLQVTTAREVSGTRAWVYQPVARRKILLLDPGPWIENPATGSTSKTQAAQ